MNAEVNTGDLLPAEGQWDHPGWDGAWWTWLS